MSRSVEQMHKPLFILLEDPWMILEYFVNGSLKRFLTVSHVKCVMQVAV